MKSVNIHHPFTQICAVIISLAATAVAEEHPDDVASKFEKPHPRPSGRAGERAPTRTVKAPKSEARKAGAPPLGGMPEGGPPGGFPEGGPPGGFPEGGPPGGFPEGGPPRGGPPGGMLILPPLRVVSLTRVDVGLAGSKLDDPFSTGTLGLGVEGNVYKSFNFTARLQAGYDPRDASGSVAMLDGIVQFEPTPEFNIWLGRQIVASDRSSLTGPWFMGPWYFPGLGYADGQVPLPHSGPFGRGDGIGVWGSLFGGHLKYYGSAADLVIPGESPLLTGRISLALLNPEPGFYNFSTYYGLDLLAIGVGAQAKKNGSFNPMTQQRDDYSELNADFLFEKDLGGAGVVDIEAAYYRFQGDNERTKSSWFGLASYVLPLQIAGVRFQPLGRVQQAVPAIPGAPTSTLIDTQLGIILKGHFARLAVGYRWAYAGPLETSALFLGLQLWRL